MPERLKDLSVERVAFVEAGDNPHADLVLYKSKRGPNVGKDETITKEPRFTSARLRRLLGVRDELSSLIVEAGGRKEDQMTDTAKLLDGLPEDTRAEVEKLLTAAEAERDAAKAEVETLKAEGETPEVETDDEVTKALAEVPEVVKDALAKAQADAEAAKADAEALRSEMAKERDERDEAEAVVKARGWKHLSTDADKLGPVLNRIAKADPEAGAEVERILTAANAIAAEAFREIGKGATDTDAQREFEAIVEGYHKDHPDMTREQAFAAVATTPEGREARKAIEKERREV